MLRAKIAITLFQKEYIFCKESNIEKDFTFGISIQEGDIFHDFLGAIKGHVR